MKELDVQQQPEIISILINLTQNEQNCQVIKIQTLVYYVYRYK